MKLAINIILLCSLLIHSCSQSKSAPQLSQDYSESITELRRLLDESDTLLDKNDLKGANGVLMEAERLSRNLNDSSTLAGIWNNIGVLQSKTGNQDSSIVAYEISIQIARELKDLYREAITLKNLAISYKAKGEFQKALSNYIESLEIMMSRENLAEIASINNGIGNIYNSLHDYEKALSYLEKAREIWSALDLPHKTVLAMGNLGNALLGLERVDEAIDIYEQTLELKRSIGKKSSIAITLNNLGEALIIKGEYTQAEKQFLESIQLREEANRRSGVSLVSNNLAALEILRGNYVEAQGWINNAKTILEKYPSSDRELENMRLQRELFAKKGNYKKAYETDLVYDQLKQTRFDDEVVKVKDEQFAFDIYQEEKAKELAQSKLAVSEKDRASQSFKSQVLTYAIIASLIIVIVVSYLALKLRKQNRHIENLMRELHHRVKNHLGMISGMFGAQTEQGNVSSADLLEEAKTRVEAVNGIHRRLYRQDEYEFVNMQEYLTELVDNSALVFGLYHNIQKELNIDTEPLEIDKAISVGLIANEVLTNGFKRLHLQKTEAPYLKIALEKAVKGYRMVIFNNAKEVEEPISESTGFGSELIRRLTANLHGESKTTQQNGFQFELTFP